MAMSQFDGAQCTYNFLFACDGQADRQTDGHSATAHRPTTLA